MNASFTAFTLLAQKSRWQHMGDGLYRSGPRAELSDLWPLLIVLAVIGVATALGVLIYKRRDYSLPCDNPHKLFRQLCAAHKLSFTNQRLLLRLATALAMPQPATLFVTPSAFASNDLPPQFRKQAQRIEALGQRLF